MSWVSFPLIVLVAGVIVAGCTAPVARMPPAAGGRRIPAAGRFVGVCAALSPVEVADRSGLSDTRLVVSNPLWCRWVTPSGAAVGFDWFRGGTFADHHPGDPGRSIARGSGVVWRGVDSCEIAMSTGAMDFISWTVQRTDRNADRACLGARNLADATIGRAGS